MALVVMGCASLTVGIVVAFAGPRLNPFHSIHTYGRIASSESQNSVGGTENLVDERGSIPIIVGVGVLSMALLYRKLGSAQAANVKSCP